MKISSLFFLMFISSGAFGLETDNYLTWDHVLPDSRLEVNDFMVKKIEEALAKANREERTFTCEEITLRIARQFKTTPTSKSLEEFVGETLTKENIYPSQGKFLEMSILNNTRFYLKYSGLSPNLQINGYYFGADKLSHFASTGRRYYKRYLKMKGQGSTEEEAVMAAIRYGLLMREVSLDGGQAAFSVMAIWRRTTKVSVTTSGCAHRVSLSISLKMKLASGLLS